MKEQDEILAKSEPRRTLIEHTKDCFYWFPEVLQWKGNLISAICDKYQLDRELVIRKLFMTIAFHDVGKANQRFQNKVRGLPPNGKESHPLASTPFISYYSKQEPVFKIKNEAYLPETLAVLTHHTKLHAEVFGDYEKTGKTIQYVEESYFECFFQMVNQEAIRLEVPGWKNLVFMPAITRKHNACEDFRTALDFVNDYSDDRKLSNLFRDVFLLFKSVLHYCDWLASARLEHYEYQYSVKESHETMTEKMRKKLATDNIEFLGWSNFQLQTEAALNNVFVKIPTGQGKTEASLLWSVNQAYPQKIIFLLPTMVTTNKMWDRLRGFFGKDWVGLSHSTARYVISEAFDNEHEESTTLRVHDLMDKTFFRPVTAATIDQLIYSFFNWGYWVLTGSAAYNARIVIDEVHCYDGYTLGLLLKTIETTKHFGAKFAIMSASFPKILQDKLEEALSPTPFDFISEPEFDQKQRHLVQISDKSIDDFLDEIELAYKIGEKVLIVCNTVKEARRVFDFFEEIPISDKMLYHSQFILEDKKKKEATLDELKKRDGKSGFLAVCTQIVEVSLDIDFHRLYSENAPIDALIQRLGRVNRKGKMKDNMENLVYANVTITKENDITRKYIYPTSILDNTRKFLEEYILRLSGNLKEIDFREIVDLVYTPENLGDEYFQKIEKGKNLIDDLWKQTVKNIFTLTGDQARMEKIASREIGVLRVDCLLQCHNQSLNFDEMLRNHQFDEVRKYVIQLPVYIATSKENMLRDYKRGEQLSRQDLYLLDIPYNDVYGLIPPNPEHLNMP
ncbi:MAG: CRISPR-associated helicase Cas3' [Saprospiraceae bacterium]|nr:CRISPR-associated helicase Cas3' [Saprospiraceae bacterium]MCF8252466.1 CRISPR-associated helicase Cas3' [Saprospiraceae bacterium]MCF8282333.1 CRISPR-associated helicase Cas3' [Bacteroidales bacterium]MCF8314047.1 CRISPR-associated helicase Cas3' [Saprospiraceae bacterium]MCF8442785.1 CRISPR-associated helicase Cas3' [Saprospiraceae bacterium]